MAEEKVKQLNGEIEQLKQMLISEQKRNKNWADDYADLERTHTDLRDKSIKLETVLEKYNTGEMINTHLKDQISTLANDVKTLQDEVGRKGDIKNDFAKCNTTQDEKFKYQKKRDAMRALPNRPKNFNRPTIMRTVNDFLDDFKKFATNNDDSKEFWFDGVQEYLEGDALRFLSKYKAMNPANTDFDSFETELTKEFGTLKLEEMKKGSMHRKQGPNETVHDFTAELEALMAKEGIKDDMALKIYTLNLREELQEAIMNDRCTNMEEAKTSAKRAESNAICASKWKGKSDDTLLKNQEALMAKLCAMEVKQVKFDNRDSRRDQYNRNRDDSRNRSYNRDNSSNRYRSNSRDRGRNYDRNRDRRDNSRNRGYDRSTSRNRSTNSNYNPNYNSYDRQRSKSPGLDSKYNRDHSRHQYDRNRSNDYDNKNRSYNRYDDRKSSSSYNQRDSSRDSNGRRSSSRDQRLN